MNCSSAKLRERPIEKKSSAASTPTDDAKRRFRAVLWEVAPLDIIQLACLRNARTSLFFLTPDRNCGTIFIDQGKIVHAECGLEGGMRALATILSWRKGEIQEFPEWLAPVERTIGLDWEIALMEASHAVDESPGQAG